jgi:hypothetical protein
MKIYLVLKTHTHTQTHTHRHTHTHTQTHTHTDTHTIYCREQMKNGASSIGCGHLFIAEKCTTKIQNTSDRCYSSSVLYAAVMVRMDSLNV